MAAKKSPMAEEFSKYNEFGAYHWHCINPRNFWAYNPRLLARYDLTLRVLKQRGYLGDRFGLDIGCGDGVLLNKIALEGPFVVGIDPALNALTLARGHLDHQSTRTVLINSSCYNMPFADESFEFVTVLDVIEHLYCPRNCMAEICRVLKPNGILVLATPQRTSRRSNRSHHHVIEFNVSELFQLMSRYFSNVQILGTHLRRWVATYTEHRGLKPKVFRLICKLATIIGLNPFMVTTNAPSETWGALLGIGYKCSKGCL